MAQSPPWMATSVGKTPSAVKVTRCVPADKLTIASLSRRGVAKAADALWAHASSTRICRGQNENITVAETPARCVVLARAARSHDERDVAIVCKAARVVSFRLRTQPGTSKCLTNFD